jgi:hypothetical protein
MSLSGSLQKFLIVRSDPCHHGARIGVILPEQTATALAPLGKREKPGATRCVQKDSGAAMTWVVTEIHIKSGCSVCIQNADSYE